MHICQKCGWIGETPNAFSADEYTSILLTLNPGDTVPSGRCPCAPCANLTLPTELPTRPLPEGADISDVMPAHGWRWSARQFLSADNLTLQLEDASSQNYAEITIDANGGRARVYVTVSRRDEDFMDQEPQIMLSLGDGHVACFPLSREEARPTIYTDDKIEDLAPMTAEDFLNLADWRDLTGGIAA